VQKKLYTKKNKIIKFAPALPVIIMILIWELAVRSNFLPDGAIFPSFSQVVSRFFKLLFDGVLLSNFLKSFIRVIAGFITGSAAGILIGVIMGWNKFIDRSLNPIFSLLYPIPALGWLPIFMLWFGIGEILPIAIVFTCSFFPVLYNTVTGIKSVDLRYVRAAQTLGASNKRILFKILIPLALPNIFTGLRLEAGMAWRVIIAAEMVAIPTGIGAMLMRAESLIRMDIIIVVLIILSAMCFLFERFFVFLEDKATSKWRQNA